MSAAGVGCRPPVVSPATEAAAGGRDRAPTRAIRKPSPALPATWLRSGAGHRASPKARFSGGGQRWSAHNIAEHASPTNLRDGVLTVAAESTAWATQLRIIQNQVLAKIAAEVGDGVVNSLRITGPVAPSWRKGPLHIAGRGPRDTYG